MDLNFAWLSLNLVLIMSLLEGYSLDKKRECNKGLDRKAASKFSMTTKTGFSNHFVLT